MGSPPDSGNPDERPQHWVTLSPFKMQAHEVTNEEYRRFDRDHDPDAPPNDPVVNINWYEALAYSAWLGGSLPTEAQWEFAARGEKGRTYPWGDHEPTRTLANYANDQLAAAGSHPLGATPEGIQDLAGNALEWCFSRYTGYVADSLSDPVGPAGGATHARVLRGGSFVDDAHRIRGAWRYNLTPSDTLNTVGFRVVWWLPGSQSQQEAPGAPRR